MKRKFVVVKTDDNGNIIKDSNIGFVSFMGIVLTSVYSVSVGDVKKY